MRMKNLKGPSGVVADAVTLVYRMLRQQDSNFEARLANLVSLYLKIKLQKARECSPVTQRWPGMREAPGLILTATQNQYETITKTKGCTYNTSQFKNHTHAHIHLLVHLCAV